ncbi:unnamed protein product [Rotaria sordida]|uniref:Uncharacterized protein n=1 Tax=Rotaria sordida TaxID=392033 RepID=A0A815G0L4_9BILA|nr:unnamed protein product [Rotaria sordida]
METLHLTDDILSISKRKTTAQTTNNHKNANFQVLLQMEELRRQLNKDLISLDNYLIEIKKLLNGVNMV